MKPRIVCNNLLKFAVESRASVRVWRSKSAPNTACTRRVGVCAFSGSFRGSRLVPANWRPLVPPTRRYSDTANWAAIAFAGGVWQPDLSFKDKNEFGRLYGEWHRDSEDVRNRRLQFWEWWLLYAVPKACEQAWQNR